MRASFFLGRIHHFLKLRPIINGLVSHGHDVQIAIARNSINIDPATEYLQRMGIDYFNHASDYITAEMVQEIDTISSSLMHFSVNKGLVGAIPPFWIASSIREAAEDLLGFDAYLNISEADAVFALHEQNFFAKILFYAAQRRGIPTFSLQEGIILAREEEAMGRYSTATEYTTRLFSWSEYDRAFYSDPSKIVPVGPPHLDEWVTLRSNVQEYFKYKFEFKKQLAIGEQEPVIAFMPPRLDLYKGDFVGDLNNLADWTRDKGIAVVLRLHPFQNASVTQYLKDNVLNKFVHVRLYDDPDGIPCIAGVDAVITQTSTVELEAVALGVPVIEIDNGCIGLEQPLWKHGAATLIENDNFDKIINVLRGEFDIDALNKFKNNRLSLADGRATERIINYVGA
jgi:hypothetical protein